MVGFLSGYMYARDEAGRPVEKWVDLIEKVRLRLHPAAAENAKPLSLILVEVSNGDEELAFRLLLSALEEEVGTLASAPHTEY